MEEDTSLVTQTDRQAKDKYKLLEDKPFEKRLNGRGHSTNLMKSEFIYITFK